MFILGNGGSYANSQHVANDLLSVGVRAFSIDPATLTAFSNDYGYEKALARWIAVVGQHDDVLIALSGSGNSKNVCNAVVRAKVHYMTTIGVTGAYEPDPRLARICHYVVRRGKDMQAAEDAQLVIGHSWMRSISRSSRPRA